MEASDTVLYICQLVAHPLLSGFHCALWFFSSCGSCIIILSTVGCSTWVRLVHSKRRQRRNVRFVASTAATSHG